MDQLFSASAALHDTEEPRGSALSEIRHSVKIRLYEKIKEQKFPEKEPLSTGQGSDLMMHLLATLGKDNESRDSTREIPLFTLSSFNPDRLLLALSSYKGVTSELVKELLSNLRRSKDTIDGFNLGNAKSHYNDEIDLEQSREFQFTRRKGWKDFAPLSYYFTCNNCFVIHVEGEVRANSLQELEDFAKDYVQRHFKHHSCKIVTSSLGAKACTSPEYANNLAIFDNSLTVLRDHVPAQHQLVGVHLQSDSTIYWISAAHGLEKVLAQHPDTLQADPFSCARCLPPNVSLSVGGTIVTTSVCKSFEYTSAFQEPGEELRPTVDIMLGPAPVLAIDVTGEVGRERIARMRVAGYLRPGGGRQVDYRITGVSGHSAVADPNESQKLVYSTLSPGAPMTEGKVVTIRPNKCLIPIRNLPREAHASGLLAIEPSDEGRFERGHSGYVEPAVGHSGSVWCIRDNSGEEPSCTVFAITVAIAGNFNGEGKKVWLVSDLQVSLNDIVSKYPNHFTHGDRSFHSISSSTTNAIAHNQRHPLPPETLR